MSRARELADLGNAEVTPRLDDIGNSEGALSNRNFLNNGAMQVAQRGTSFTVSGSSQSVFTLDRFRFGNEVGEVTITQNSVTDLPGFANSAKLSVTDTGTLATGEQCVFEQKIEAQNCIPFGFGSSSASPLTLTFYAKSNNTDTRVAWFYYPDGGRSMGKTFANTVADTWEKITIEIPADTGGGGFNDDSGAGLYVRFVLASGSQFTGGINTSWAPISNNRYQGVSDFLASTSNYFEVTGVQLEVGDVATPFEHRSYGDELQRCQRYYYRRTGSGRHAIAGNGSILQSFPTTHLPVPMRAQPSLSYSALSDFRIEGLTGGTTSIPTAISFNAYADTAFTMNCIVSGESSTKVATQLLGAGGGSASYTEFDAEL